VPCATALDFRRSSNPINPIGKYFRRAASNVWVKDECLNDLTRYRTNALSVVSHYRLMALHRLALLSVGIAYDGVRSHCHWTGVHRFHLKA
jgi:hypothetical protein